MASPFKRSKPLLGPAIWPICSSGCGGRGGRGCCFGGGGGGGGGARARRAFSAPFFLPVRPRARAAPRLFALASPVGFAAALEGLEPPAAVPWREHTQALHAGYVHWSQTPTEVPGPVNFGTVVAFLRDRLPADAIICNGAGNYSAWIHRFYRFH